MKNIQIVDIKIEQIKYLNPGIRNRENRGFEGNFNEIDFSIKHYKSLKFESFDKLKNFLLNSILPSKTRFPVYANRTIGDETKIDFVISKDGVIGCCFYVKDSGRVASKEDMIRWIRGEYRYLWLRSYDIHLKVVKDEYIPDTNEIASWKINNDSEDLLSLRLVK